MTTTEPAPAVHTEVSPAALAKPCRAFVAFHSTSRGGDVTVTCDHAACDHHGGRHADPVNGFFWHDGKQGRATEAPRGCAAWCFDASAGVVIYCRLGAGPHDDHEAKRPYPIVWRG